MTSLPNSFSPRRWEWIVVLTLIAGGLILNLATYNLYPTVWADEVLWSEPAINLVKTGQFTTSVWQFQRAGSFWAAQSPLYCFALAGWMKAVGTDLLAARSFNFALVSLGIYLTWLASWRCRLISRPLLRILIVPLLLGGYGMSFCYRCSRPDIAGMVCLLCFGLAFFIRREKLRLAAQFLCALAAPWIGIQVALALAIVCALAKLFFAEVTMRRCILLAAGVCLGLASMLVFYHSHGVLADLMKSISQAANEKQHWGQTNSYWASIPRRLADTLRAYADDVSCFALLAGLLAAAALYRREFFSRTNRGVLLLATIVLAIPLVLSMAAHFAFYYAYMIYIPAVLAFLGTLEMAANSNARRGWLTGLCAAAVIGVGVMGLPLRLFIAIQGCDIVPRSQYTTLLQSILSPDDVVFSDYTAFFECKAVVPLVYSPMYSRHFVDLSPAAQDFTDEEKRKVNVLVIPASQADAMKLYWGGEWSAVTQPFGDSIRAQGLITTTIGGRLIRSYLSNPQAVRRPLQVFRRTSTALSASE